MSFATFGKHDFNLFRRSKKHISWIIVQTLLRQQKSGLKALQQFIDKLDTEAKHKFFR